MMRTALKISALAAATGALAAPVAGAQGPVLLSGYGAPGISEESILGTGGHRDKPPAGRAAERPTTAADLVATAQARPTPATAPVASAGSSATTHAPRTQHAHKPSRQSRASAAAPAHASAAVVAAAARTPADGGSGTLWIFGGALAALALAGAAFWRRGAR